MKHIGADTLAAVRETYNVGKKLSRPGHPRPRALCRGALWRNWHPRSVFRLFRRLGFWYAALECIVVHFGLLRLDLGLVSAFLNSSCLAR